MTAGAMLDAGLCLLLLALAVWVITVRQTFSAIIGFVAAGLLLAIAWVRLASIDVALTEAVVGSGLSGALLIGAAARLRPAEGNETRPAVWLHWAAAALSAAVAAGLAAVMLLLPDPAPSLAPLAVATLAESGVDNAVSAVLVVYRALDTFMEVVVLLVALVGVWSLAPQRLWGGIAGTMRQPRTGDALTTLSRVLPPVGILAGIHVFWAGSSGPGGEFQGAAIIAAMWLLVMLSGLRPPPATIDRRLLRVLLAGPAVFLCVGLLGFAWAAGFLAYPQAFAKPVIVAVEAVLLVSIAAMLALLAIGPPIRAAE